MRRALIVSLRMVVITIVLTGFVYPLVVWGISAVVFPKQAAGSLVTDASGSVVGSRLIAPAASPPTSTSTRGPRRPVPTATTRCRRARATSGRRARRWSRRSRAGSPRSQHERPRREGRDPGRRGHRVGQRPRPGHHAGQCRDAGGTRREGSPTVRSRRSASWSPHTRRRGSSGFSASRASTSSS